MRLTKNNVKEVEEYSSVCLNKLLFI